MLKQNWQVADPLDYELLKVNAKENRRNMTDAESIFWQMAKGGEDHERSEIPPYFWVMRVTTHVNRRAPHMHQHPLYPSLLPNTCISHLTESERCRRQYVIGDYIVDFFFRKSMLIVEIDGGYHTTKEQQLKDVERQDWLEHNDYRVLRFTNVQVLCDIDNVVKIIKQNLRHEQ